MRTKFGSRPTRLWVGLLPFVATVAVAGCGGVKTQTVQGTVSYQGKPLPSGVVRIHGPGDRLATAMIQPDGTFSITDVLPGDVRVSVVDDPSSSSRASMPPPPGAPAAKAAAPAEPVKRIPIPAKYQDANTSALAYTITRDTKKLEVKLE